ncbi:MAG: hypothetical protein KDK66_01430 [Deltaproteobacteria bacterium]|nr:hypothetical protein [Deltaproteobacteria bacterium]
MGTAPCPQNGLLSLAICKPVIRRCAQVDDWLFGFGGKPLDGRLIYIAQITERLENGIYYKLQKHARRLDCIYRHQKGKAKRKVNALVHEEYNLPHDVGLKFERGHVLLSTNFRYLGGKGTTEYKRKFPKLAAWVAKGTQGHRFPPSPEIEAELFKLQKSIWKQYPRKIIGKPSDPIEEACQPKNKSLSKFCKVVC